MDSRYIAALKETQAAETVGSNHVLVNVILSHANMTKGLKMISCSLF